MYIGIILQVAINSDTHIAPLLRERRFNPRQNFSDRLREAGSTVHQITAFCQMSEEGGKEFARIIMVAVAEAALEVGDIFYGVARKLLTFRPGTSHNSMIG